MAVILCAGTCNHTAQAESWRTTRKACAFWAQDKKDYHNLEECLTDGFQLEPIGPAAGSIGSGSSFASGLRFVHHYNRGRFQSNVTVRGFYSLKNFYLLDGTYTMTMPPVGRWKTIPTNTTKFVDDDLAQIKLDVSRMDLRSQD